MAMRPCLGLATEQCDQLTNDPSSRCPDHKRRYEAARRPDRPTARQRGYDAAHDRLRARLLPLAYGKPCPRCGEIMTADQALDLGHPPGRARAEVAGSRADRIEHSLCNRSAGAA